MNAREVLDIYGKYVIPNYTRFPVVLVRGEGSSVWDADGNRYLDFFPGWGCGMIGHCPPRVVEAVREQVGKLIHVPNTWYTEPQGLLAKALSELPDLILLDLIMPKVDGVEACRRIRAQPETKAIPIIMVTTRSEAELVENSYKTGCNDFINKPINNSELLAKVRSILGA